jgi:membrane associated rhomboid family serine protease
MIFPIGRDTLAVRFPWATALLLLLSGVCFTVTWPREQAFRSARAGGPLVVEARALASLALDGGSTLPAEARTRLEDLRASPAFPDDEADVLLRSIEKTFDHLPTLRRHDWNPRYAAYLKAKKEVDARGVPWRSPLDGLSLRSQDPLWPRLASHPWAHAGWAHLLCTLFFLWLAGSHLEEKTGFLGILFLFAAGVAASALTVRAVLPGGDWVLLGGAGAAAALVGYLAARRPGEPVRCFYFLLVANGVFSPPAWAALVLWVPAALQAGRLSEGRVEGLAGHVFQGAGLAVGVAAALAARLLFKKSATDEPGGVALDRRVEAAARLAGQGKVEAARDACLAVLGARPDHIGALQGLLAAHETLKEEDAAGRAAARIIKAALDQGRGQLAEETFRRWSLKLFQTKLTAQERAGLAQNLETMGLLREALAYHRSVVEQNPSTPFAAKALFASAQIHKTLKKPDEAVQALRQLLDPPYDVEWRGLAEGELRALGKL